MVSILLKNRYPFGPITISLKHGLYTLDWSKPVVNGLALTIGRLVNIENLCLMENPGPRKNAMSRS